MKINHPPTICVIEKFSNVKIGECFRYQENIYIKTDNPSFNSICVSSGKISYIHDYTEIQIIDGEFSYSIKYKP